MVGPSCYIITARSKQGQVSYRCAPNNNFTTLIANSMSSSQGCLLHLTGWWCVLILTYFEPNQEQVKDTMPPLQEFDGFGGALSDSSAFLLSKLKGDHPELYWQLLHLFFNASVDGSAGLAALRLPITSTDFSVGYASAIVTTFVTRCQCAIQVASFIWWRGGGLYLIKREPPGWQKICPTSAERHHFHPAWHQDNSLSLECAGII